MTNDPSRIGIPEMLVRLAMVAALRSEDPYTKVGAAAADSNNRFIGLAYNGLPPGFTAPEGFWDDRDSRMKFMIHAEVNLCSLVPRGTIKKVGVTHSPCIHCAQLLAAHGVKEIYFMWAYERDNAFNELTSFCQLFEIKLQQVVPPSPALLIIPPQ